ncbi:MAG: hypothetical protein ACE5MB_06490 [Anaerolineae bacterium]
MTQIRCYDDTCVFWEGGVCSSEEMEYHPDHGCLTMQEREEYEEEEMDWEEIYEEEWEEEPFEEE